MFFHFKIETKTNLSNKISHISYLQYWYSLLLFAINDQQLSKLLSSNPLLVYVFYTIPILSEWNHEFKFYRNGNTNSNSVGMEYMHIFSLIIHVLQFLVIGFGAINKSAYFSK